METIKSILTDFMKKYPYEKVRDAVCTHLRLCNAIDKDEFRFFMILEENKKEDFIQDVLLVTEEMDVDWFREEILKELAKAN
ncbi:MAG: hypothetical protein HUJ68_04170 [Clostridia bacterium]|nr:hypothetical protein [Clostridia bacterium]